MTSEKQTKTEYGNHTGFNTFEKITNRRIIATEFNKYFISLASNLNSAVEDITLPDLTIPTFYEYLSHLTRTL